MGGQKWKRPFWGGRRARFGGNRAKWGHWGWPMMWVCLPQCQGVDATQGAIFLPGGVEGGLRGESVCPAPCAACEAMGLYMRVPTTLPPLSLTECRRAELVRY